MNVGDDQVDSGDLDKAETTYTITLARAEQLSGYGQAKIRFIALEGLGRIRRIQWEHTSRREMGLSREVVGECLQEAYRYVDEAFGVAVAWFEVRSRFTCRITEQRAEVLGLLASCGLQPPDEPGSEG